MLAYSVICLLMSISLLWLIVNHKERASYLAMLSGFVTVNVVASIVQQVHTMVWWNDVKQAQHRFLVDHVGNPEVAITGGSAGVDLAFFYVQYYTYNVDGLIVLFWAFELMSSVYQLQIRQRIGPHVRKGVKCVAVLLPVLQVGLLHIKVVQSSTPAFLFVHNVFSKKASSHSNPLTLQRS